MFLVDIFEAIMKYQQITGLQEVSVISAIIFLLMLEGRYVSY